MISLLKDIPKEYRTFKYRYHWFYCDNFLTVRYNSEDGKDKAITPYILADGQWQNKAPEVPCPLYNQQEIKDEPKDQSAFVCEGEKKAAALRSLGLLATTSLGGANGALKSDWSCLSEFETVYIISDNDEAGKKYVNDVALKLLSLKAKPKAIYFVDLPDLSESEDVVDWIKKEIPEWDEYRPIPSDKVEDIRNKLLKVIEENRQPISELWDSIKNMEETTGPDIPAILLPETLNRFVKALANQFEIAEGVVVLAILGIISSAINKKFDIVPREAWNEPINTYAFIALPPANNKSAILRNVMKPIILWEKQQREILEPKIRKQFASNKLVEEKIKSIRKKIAEAENILNEFSLQQRLTELEKSLIEPDIIPQIFINDTTPEALSNTIHQQGNKGAIISDEGGVMESLSGLYSGNRSNVDIILKGIDGGDVRVRRKDRNYDLNPYITILMIVQPQILMNMQDKDSFKGNGFLERFLYLIPKSNLGYRSLNTQATPKELID
ncbi:MAG: DUF3987 domain-containing protein [Alphaproteobacteria bacterium]|nr:DUF3987 domain-containing protein [Alphaproteobacteria bacterium]OJV15331.1 MAG: hypothetical protein BGO27_02355 [Alphaproteobacteria bacterium 33-17]